jgi:hypothetical protein
MLGAWYRVARPDFYSLFYLVGLFLSSSPGAKIAFSFSIFALLLVWLRKRSLRKKKKLLVGLPRRA